MHYYIFEKELLRPQTHNDISSEGKVKHINETIEKKSKLQPSDSSHKVYKDSNSVSKS